MSRPDKRKPESPQEEFLNRALAEEYRERGPMVYLELDFPGGLRDKLDHVSEWVVRAEKSILQPVLERLRRDRAEALTSAPYTSEWGVPGGIHAGVSALSRAGGRVILSDYTPQGVARVMKRLASGALGNLKFDLRTLGANGYPDDRGLAIAVDFKSIETPESSDVLWVWATRALLGDDFVPHGQDVWVELAKSGAEAFDAAAGYLTMDFNGSPNDSPYELIVRRNSRSALKECRRWLRGYYWGDFLGAGHIKQLGGRDHVLREAPVFLAEELVNGVIYLQLSESLDDFSDDALRALREFLAPVLPQADFEYPYIGPPLRVLEMEE